jgi:hypothetical protein
MIDSVRLFAYGVCAAALAWGLWAWLGEYMVVVLNIAAFSTLLLENRQLRRQLRAMAAAQGARTLGTTVSGDMEN